MFCEDHQMMPFDGISGVKIKGEAKNIKWVVK